MESRKATGPLSKVLRHALGAAATFLFCCGIAQATIIFSGSATLSAGDPTQSGRLSRNGIAQDWTGGEPFPGVVNAGTLYQYTTIDIDVSALEAGYVFGGFLQIEFFATAPVLFLGAYAGSYNPADLSANWLGDGGTSPPIFGANSTFFQLVAGAGDHIILVMNETTPGAGLGLLGEITIEAFSDVNFTDLVVRPTSEPGTLAILGIGLVLLIASRRTGVRPTRAARS